MTRIVSLLTALIAAVAAPGQVLGGIFSNSSDLPQTGWVYQPVEDVPVQYTAMGLTVTLSQIHHIVGTPIVLTPSVPNEVEDFPSTMNGMAAVNGASVGSVTLTGPSTTLVLNRIGFPTGTFDTEMLALSLVGNIGGMSVMIRESPTLASRGRTSIMPPGPGPYQIDSFFDVFTELSVDGGVSWIPSNGPARVTLTPEPGTWATLAVGLALLGWMVRRRVA